MIHLWKGGLSSNEFFFYFAWAGVRFCRVELAAALNPLQSSATDERASSMAEPVKRGGAGEVHTSQPSSLGQFLLSPSLIRFLAPSCTSLLVLGDKIQNLKLLIRILHLTEKGLLGFLCRVPLRTVVME